MLTKVSSIRRKTTLTLFITTIFLIGVIAAACVYILLPGYARLEENSMRGGVHSSLMGLDQEIADLRRIAADEALLDAAAGGAQPSADILENQRLDLLLGLSPSGEVLFVTQRGAAGPLPGRSA